MDAKETKKYLNTYAGLKMKVDNQLERIARAENDTRIPAMKQSDGSQRTPGRGDRFEKSIIKHMDIKERLLPLIEENISKMQQIEDMIESLEDPFESEVLRLRYLDGEHNRQMPWKDVATILYGDDDENCKQATYRLHGRALQSLGKVLEEYNAKNDLDM